MPTSSAEKLWVENWKSRTVQQPFGFDFSLRRGNQNNNKVCFDFDFGNSWSCREFGLSVRVVINDQNKEKSECMQQFGCVKDFVLALTFSSKSSLRGSKQQQQDEFVLISTFDY
jgi:hypothetical protein